MMEIAAMSGTVGCYSGSGLLGLGGMQGLGCVWGIATITCICITLYSIYCCLSCIRTYSLY